MPKFLVHGAVRASKYIGTYEAESKEEVEEMAWEDAHVSVCHQCSREVEDPEIDELFVEECADTKEVDDEE